jgi:general secretion pathway protein I
MNTRARQDGFTLLEVIVAVVILATALGLLLGMLSRGMHQVTQAQAESEAAMYAQSLLDQLGTIEVLEPVEKDGDFADGRYRWHLQVAPTIDPAPPPPAEPGAPPPQPAQTETSPTLYRVRLDVSWGGGGQGRQLRFETLRLRAPSLDAAQGEAQGEAPVDAANDAASASGAGR